MHVRFRSVIHFLIFSLTLSLLGCTEKTSDNTLTDTTLTWLWVDQTSTYLPVTAEWTNRVEVADINGDGLLDLLFANGGDYSEPGTPEPSRVFINQGPNVMFKEVTTEIFGEKLFYARVIKVRDLNKDGFHDIFVGTTFQTQSQLYLGTENGTFKNATNQLPQLAASIGDVEFGDVDNDGDLDIILADWGPGSNMENAGGLTQLWINDGAGFFKDVTATQMPSIPIQFSWDLEFIDVDNDFDLDIGISCKRCGTSRVFINNGVGIFENKRMLPAYTNNYELEAMDVNKDGFLDFVTVNDGEIVHQKSWSRREHLFLNDNGKLFTDATLAHWPDSENIGEDDNNIVFLDYDSDGDPDFLLSSLTGEDRLLVNNGQGVFNLHQPILKGDPTPHTLSMVVGDINNDNKMDIIMGQGEGTEIIEERIFIGTGIAKDTAPPIIANYQFLEDTVANTFSIKARVHDHKSPNMPQDWESVVLWIGKESITLEWYGENLWKVTSKKIEPDVRLQICATDYSGNKKCRQIRR